VTARRLRFRARDGLLLSALDHPGDERRTPVLCLPGLTRSAADFAAIAARQAPGRRVLALDHAGHGESAPASSVARYRIEESLRDVLDAMAALHCPRAVIIGTSFGGMLAMVLGVLRPTAIAGVVLNDIGPVLEPEGLAQVRDFIARDPALRDLDEVVTYLQAVLPPLTLDEEGWNRFAANTFRAGADGRWHPQWDMRLGEVLDASGPPPPLWNAFGALAHAPVLLLRGEVSTLLSPATVAAMRARRPDLHVAEIAGTGHSPTLEEPAALAAIDRFLEAIP
jgi:pimeloyl-ACP methyl ester carboxylesterase